MKVIVVEPNLDIRAIIRLNFVKLGEAQIIEKDSIEEVWEWKEILPDIEHCVIRTELINSGNKEIVDKLFQHKLKMVYINPDVLKLTNGKLDFDSGKFDRLLKENLFQGQSEATQVALKRFLPVPIDYFYHINELNFNAEIFLKIKSADGDRFVKRLDGNDKFNTEEIDKYKKLGVTNFYVPTDRYVEFANYLTDKLMLKMMDSEGGTEANRVKVESSTYQITLERIHSIGIDDRTIDAVNETIKSIETSIKKTEALGDYFSKLKENNASYSYSHSYLISLLLYKVVEFFEWKNESIKDKLTFVAYFHDIALKTDELIRVSKLKNLDSISSDKAKKVINEHAYLGAAIVGKFPNAPIGASQIICEHHGMKTGMGVSETLNLNLQSLSKVFIVVEYFVTEYLERTTAPSKEEVQLILFQMKKKFNKDIYLDTVFHLEKIVASGF